MEDVQDLFVTVVEFDKQQPAKTDGFAMYKIRTEVCINLKPPQQFTLHSSVHYSHLVQCSYSINYV